MSSKTLGRMIRFSVIALALCGLWICVYYIPIIGIGLLSDAPEFSNWYVPWLLFAWTFAIPCFATLYYVWMLSDSVINETVFTIQTSKWVKTGSYLIMSACIILFVGNMILTFANMNHPSFLVISIIAEIFGITLALLAAVLSSFLLKGTEIKEENEGTL